MARKTSIATILYPENETKETYVERIEKLHIKAYLSPLHLAEGKEKKDHYHLLLFFGSTKSDSQIKEIVASVGGVGCEPIISNRGYARYLCHIDSPKKIQYRMDDVLEFGGIEPYSDYIANKDDKNISEFSLVIDFCKEFDIVEWYQLIEYCVECDSKMLQVVLSNSYPIREYLKSKKFSNI